MKILELWSNLLWNPWILSLFLITGLVLSIQGGWFPLFHIRLWLSSTLSSILRPSSPVQGLSSLQALFTALASTLGTGSIAGVATAIYLGGPGAVFWMWISSILALSTSCVEKILAVHYHQPDPSGGWLGGPMYYLRHGLHAPILAACFSLACLPATLAGGNLVQASSITSALDTGLHWPPWLVSLGLVTLTGLVMMGGIGRIAPFCSKLVPVMSLLYLTGGIGVLILRWESVPHALTQIVTYALSPSALLAGGVGYYTLSRSLYYGVTRGVFTNEAGLGTSAMAHGAAVTDHPGEQGMWGILEVVCSTFVVCTLTALVILVAGVYQPVQAAESIQQGRIPPSMLGVSLTSQSFQAVLGPVGGQIVTWSLLLFAFSSILGWSYYGEQALHYLTQGHPPLLLYRLLFLACLLLGGLWQGELVWQLVDLCNGLMALPNLIGLLCLAPQAYGLLQSWLAQRT